MNPIQKALINALVPDSVLEVDDDTKIEGLKNQFPASMKKGLEVDSLGNVWKGISKTSGSTIDDFMSALPGMIYPITTAIAQDFAKIELSLVKGDEGDIFQNNAAWTTLRRVNEGDTFYNLAESYGYYMSLAGEAFWYMPKADNSNLREIFALNPLQIQSVSVDDWGRITSIEYRVKAKGKGSKSITIKSDELIMDKTFNPGNPTRGFSPLAPVTTAVDASEAALEYNRKFFENDATPSLLIKVKNKMTDAMKAVFKANWLRQFKGKDKAHKFALADADMEVEPLSMSNRDMAFNDLLKAAVERQLSNWRVNKTILGQTENVNRATLEGAEVNHSKRVIEPMMERFVAFLNEKYLLKFFTAEEIERQNIHFEFKSPVQADVESNANVAQTGLAGDAYITVNEARELNGLPPMEGEENDEIPERKPIAAPSSPDNEDEDDDDKALLLDRVKYLTKRIDDNKELVSGLKHDLKKSDGYEATKQIKRDEWEKEHLERAFKNEPLYRSDLIKYFDGFEERIIEGLVVEASWKKMQKEGKAMVAKVSTNDEFDIMKQTMRPATFKIAEEAWRAVDRKVPGHVAFDDENLDLRAFVSESMNIYIRETTSTSFEDFNQIFEEALVTGASTDEIAKSIGELFDGYRGARSKGIARTEVNNISNTMAVRRYSIAKEDGLLEEKEWLTTGDDKVRESHAAADGQKVGVDKPFIVGGEKMENPGDSQASAGNRINCRCAVLPVID